VVGSGVPELTPLLRGGGQEFGLRAGTPSPAQAAANALAFSLAVEEHAERAEQMRAARDAFVAGLAACGAVPLTPLDRDVLPNTAMIECDVADGRRLLPALDRAGVEASHGSACSSGAPTPPRVLLASGLTEARARRCVRFSFSHETSIDAAREAARRVCEVVTRLRRST
jgi:cysteine desulfurase